MNRIYIATAIVALGRHATLQSSRCVTTQITVAKATTTFSGKSFPCPTKLEMWVACPITTEVSITSFVLSFVFVVEFISVGFFPYSSFPECF